VTKTDTEKLSANIIGMAHYGEFYCRECCNKEIAQENSTVQDFLDGASRGGFHLVFVNTAVLICQGCETINLAQRMGN